MQSVTYQHHSQRLAVPLKTQNHFKPQRRDSIQHRVILAAVREWESTLPGQAQERIAQLVANAIKECSEAHQAKLIGAPLQKLEKEIREAAIALFNMLPADAAGPLLASLSAVAPQLF
ncbi:hypothetical protein ACV8TH_22075 [Citrobacter freundii]